MVYGDYFPPWTVLHGNMFDNYICHLFMWFATRSKTKAASSKCLFDKSFLNTVAFSTPLIEEVISHPMRAC